MVPPTKCGDPEKSTDFYPTRNGVIKVDSGVNYTISYNVDLISHIKTPKIDNSVLNPLALEMDIYISAHHLRKM